MKTLYLTLRNSVTPSHSIKLYDDEIAYSADYPYPKFPRLVFAGGGRAPLAARHSDLAQGDGFYIRPAFRNGSDTYRFIQLSQRMTIHIGGSGSSQPSISSGGGGVKKATGWSSNFPLKQDYLFVVLKKFTEKTTYTHTEFRPVFVSVMKAGKTSGDFSVFTSDGNENFPETIGQSSDYQLAVLQPYGSTKAYYGVSGRVWGVVPFVQFKWKALADIGKKDNWTGEVGHAEKHDVTKSTPFCFITTRGEGIGGAFFKGWYFNGSTYGGAASVAYYIGTDYKFHFMRRKYKYGNGDHWGSDETIIENVNVAAATTTWLLDASLATSSRTFRLY